MTATIIQGPWRIEAERRIVAKFKALWPKLNAMSDTELASQFDRAGIDPAAVMELQRILLKHHSIEETRSA